MNPLTLSPEDRFDPIDLTYLLKYPYRDLLSSAFRSECQIGIPADIQGKPKDSTFLLLSVLAGSLVDNGEAPHPQVALFDKEEFYLQKGFMKTYGFAPDQNHLTLEGGDEKSDECCWILLKGLEGNFPCHMPVVEVLPCLLNLRIHSLNTGQPSKLTLEFHQFIFKGLIGPIS
jgi:hypothetical protein